jgi:hypothetical protein
MTTRDYADAYEDDSENTRGWPAQDAQEPPTDVRTVTTVNSVYQINEADHLIRRVAGVSDPTPRQGVDGVWSSYVAVRSDICDGLFILWGYHSNGVAKCTVTSKVVGDTHG